MTSEEEKRLLATVLRTDMSAPRAPSVNMMAGQQSGTSGPYMTPEQLAAATRSTSGQELGLKNQLAQANALRGAEAAKGKTVGPYDLYMGPNWGDMAASVGKQLTGGYMAGQANEGLKGLDEKQSAVALEKAINEQKRQQFEDSLAASAVDYEKSRDEEADLDDERDAKLRLKEYQSSAASRVASAGQARANSGIPMIQLDEEGTPMQNSVRFATKRPDGMYFGDEKVDESTWQPWDNPNLNAAKLEDTKPKTQADKKAQYLSELYTESVDSLFANMESGYDPTGGRALVDTLTTPNDVTNWIASDAGQQWAADKETVKDSALRTATGAAAPGTEQARQVLALIPRPGDKEGTLARKKVKLRVYGAALARLGDLLPSATPDELVALAMREANEVGNDIPEDSEQPEVVNTKTVDGVTYVQRKDGKWYQE